MSTIRESMQNPWWAEMYNRYAHRDPSNKNYGVYHHAGTHQPLTIGGTSHYTVMLRRNMDGVHAYKVGGISEAARYHQNSINQCVKQTGAPDLCAAGYLGANPDWSPSTQFDRMG